MLYVDNRPVNRFAKAPTRNRFYQFRQFVDGVVVDQLRDMCEPVETRKNHDEMFLIPGRDEHVVKIVNGETFAMRTLMGRDAGVEEWEVDARETLPIRRGLSAVIGARVPRLRTALMTFMDAEPLSDAMAKKSRRFNSSTSVEELKFGEVTVLITDHEIHGEGTRSVVLRATSSEAICEALKVLPLDKEQGSNMNDFLGGCSRSIQD